MSNETGQRTAFDLLMVVGPLLVLIALFLTATGGGNPAFGLLLGAIGVTMVVVWWVQNRRS